MSSRSLTSDGSLSRDLQGEGSFHQVVFTDGGLIPTGSTVSSVRAVVGGFMPYAEPVDNWSGRFYWAYNNNFPQIATTEGEHTDTRVTAPDGTAWTLAKALGTSLGLEITAGFNPTNPVHRFNSAELIVNFTLPTPTATTGVASDITPTSARLNATINPNGANATYPVSYKFQWGLTTSYGNETTLTGGQTGSAPIAVSALLSGLTGNTIYHFRVVASNADGTTNGADGTFSTVTGDPPTFIF